MGPKGRYYGFHTGLQEKTFSFSFSLLEDRENVWNGRIGHVNHALLILKEWDHNLTIKELNFNTASFWIQAHGILFVCMRVKLK